jgi:hypothetical protein
VRILKKSCNRKEVSSGRDVDVNKQSRHKGHKKEQNASCRKGSKWNQQEGRQYQETTATSEDYQQQRKWQQHQE